MLIIHQWVYFKQYTYLCILNSKVNLTNVHVMVWNATASYDVREQVVTVYYLKKHTGTSLGYPALAYLFGSAMVK